MCASSHSGGFTIAMQRDLERVEVECRVERERALARVAPAPRPSALRLRIIRPMVRAAKPVVCIVTPGHAQREQRQLAHRGAVGRSCCVIAVGSLYRASGTANAPTR